MPIRNKVLIVVLISTIFGLLAGAVGSIVARVYLLEDVFNVPFVGEINLSANPSQSNFVIRGAKRVVVEQNQKVLEAVQGSREVLMTIHEKIEVATSSSESQADFDINNFYDTGNNLGSAFVVTSDGWLVGTELPVDLGRVLSLNPATSSKVLDAIEGYVVIDSDDNIYQLTKVIKDPLSSLVYWKIDTRDLPVRRFVETRNIKNGQLVIVVNDGDQVMLSNVSSIKKSTENLVQSSDFSEEIALLNNEISDDFVNSYVVDLNGDLLGLSDKEGEIFLINNYLSCINCLLEQGEIKRPFLGVNYINLNSLISASAEEGQYGALISKNKLASAVEKKSPAELAGLEEGDIILAIDGVELKNGRALSELISDYSAGDEIEIEYLRAGKNNQIQVVLGELID